jgi:hypothetical protein
MKYCVDCDEFACSLDSECFVCGMEMHDCFTGQPSVEDLLKESKYISFEKQKEKLF